MNLITSLDGASNLQVAERTEEHVKLHHGDANSKVQTRKSVGQTTWFLKQTNFKGRKKEKQRGHLWIKRH